MPEYNAQKRKRGLLTEQTDGGENRAARLAAEKKSAAPSARVPDVWQAPRERDRDPFRTNVEEAAAAHRRLAEIADARRDAQDNPTKFHNIKQQKDFLAYLDEEETGARARESEMLAENFRILQNQGQNGSKMLYNTSSARVLEQETVDRMASVIRAGLEANGILPASSGKPATSGSPEWEIAPNARRTGASGTVDAAKRLAPVAPAKANQVLPADHSDGEDEDAARLGEMIWSFIQRLFSGRDKPSATPAPTPTPQTVTLYPKTTPATVSFYAKTTPSPTPPPWPTDAETRTLRTVPKPGAPASNTGFPLLWNREMTDTGGGTRDTARNNVPWWNRGTGNQTKNLRNAFGATPGLYRDDIERVLDDLDVKQASTGLSDASANSIYSGIGRIALQLGQLYEDGNEYACRYEYGEWDCSHFVADVYKLTGVLAGFPAGTSKERQYAVSHGWTVATAKDADQDLIIPAGNPRTGDILMWRNKDGSLWHTAIALGDEYVIDCSPNTKGKEAGICIRKIYDVNAQLYQCIQPPEEYRLTQRDIQYYLELLGQKR